MLASKQGLPVNIYRPKDITGHSRTGAWKAEGFLCSFFRTVIDMGSCPDIPLPLNYVPVDFAAQAIVHIARQSPPSGRVFHLNNLRYRLLPTILDAIRAMGYPVRRLSYEDWVQELVHFSAKNPATPLTPFVPLFVERWSEENLTHIEMYYEGKIPRFECHNTLEALKGTEIVCPPVDDALLGVYMSYFLRTGFFPPPDQIEGNTAAAVTR